MAYPIVTKDKITITGIPDDVKKDDPRLMEMVAQLRSFGQTSGIWGVPVTQDPPVEEEQSAFRKFFPKDLKDFGEQAARQAGLAARGLVQGAAGIPGIIIDPVVAAANMVLPENMQQATPRQLADSLMQQAGVPNPETNLEKLAATGYNAMGGSGGGKIVGDLLTKAPGILNTIGQTMAANIGQQVTGDIAAGSASEIARQQGASPLVQTGAGLVAGTGSGIATGMTRKPVTPGIIDEAEAAGINLMTTDVFPPKTPTGKQVQTLSEMIPFVGTGGKRVSQQAERVNAVDDIIRQYDANDLEGLSAEVMKDLTSRVGKEGVFFKKWGGEKNEVIRRLSDADISPVPLARTNAKIDEEIAKLVELKSENYKPVIKVLEDWKNALNGQNLENVETLRKDVGKIFSDPNFQGPADVGEKALRSIYGPLNEDMGEQIKRIGSEADYNKWKVANVKISKKLEELKLPVLETVLKKGVATPNEVNKLLFSKNSSDIRALYRNLSPDGRALARAAVIARAAEKSGGGTNPDAFAKEVGKLSKSVGVLFSEDDLSQVKGLVKVLNMTSRAQESASSPRNGFQSLLPLGMLGAGFAAEKAFDSISKNIVPSALAGAASLVPRVYESKAVRNILINMSKVTEGTPEFKALTAVLMNVLATESQKMQGDTTPVKKERTNSVMLN